MKPFGADVTTKVNFGSKYKFKPDSNPPVGAYEVEKADKLIRNKSRDTIIREPVLKEKRKKDASPDPGAYQADIIEFGKGLRNSAGMGSKYKFKPKEGPGPGEYEADRAKTSISFTNKTTIIREETSPYRRPADRSPDPG